MQEYQQRIVDEKAQLDGRLANLNQFMGTIPFERLSRDEQCRMTTQMHLMCSYSAVLGARITAFEP